MRRSSRRSLPVTHGAAWRAAFFVAVVVAPVAAQQPQPIKFVRYAHVANDGAVAFTYQDDIWVAGPDGSNPRRLTAHVARDFSPRFSPDGRSVAFTSNRTGNNDVYVIPVGGGEPRQLTFFSGDDQALYWTPDGKGIVIATSRGAYAWGSPLYVQPLDGSLATPLPMDIGRTGMIKQDQTMVAFNRALPSYWRKGFKGNATADIAVQDLKTGEIVEFADADLRQFRTFVSDVHPMWGADGMIYYASERDGFFNLWRTSPKGGTPQQVTSHKDDGVQFPAISPDGKRIIYENNFELWTLDVPNGQPRKLTIAMAFDPKENDVEVLTTQNRAEGFSPAPSGDYLAVDFHGEIVLVPTEQGVGEMTRVTTSPWRERNQTYSPDGKKIAYVSDESGEEEIWLYDVAAGTRRKVTTHQSIKGDITWAASSQKLAFTGANRIFEADVAQGAVRELAYNSAGGFSISQYGPDENWLVYMRRDLEQNAEVYLYDIRNKREHNVTQSPFTEGNGTLTPDGKTLIFTSNRVGATNQLFAVSLTRRTEDANDPLVRERRRREEGGTGGRGGGGGAAAPAAPVDIRIDTAGIEGRAVQLTRGSASVGSYFLSRDGRTIYFTIGGGGGFGGGRGRGGGGGTVDTSQNGLYAISVEGRDRRRIAAGTYAGMQPTADRRAIFFRGVTRAPGGEEEEPPQGGRGGGAGGFEVHRLAIPGGTGGAAAGPGGGPGGGGGAQRGERINFNFSVRVDRRTEWNQVFEEAWRVMKYRFYDEKMHGYDWNAIRARYRPLLRHVGTNEDLYDLANEMIGEIAASHTGVSGPPTRTMPRLYTTRFLGFEMEPAGGRYRISHLYRDGPADKEWLDLKVGDFVLAIDGQEVKAGDDYWKILSDADREYIPVRVAKAASGDGARVVRIASVTSLTDIRYREWVLGNRAIVEKETNGQIAYVHIRAMNQPSLEVFRDEIDRFWNRKGIIVDVRFNGGGNIDQEVLEILSRRPYEFWNSRNSAPTWGRRPRQAIAGPKVMMINQRSVSDAEVTPMGFRDLGLGRLVGNPTAAQVIATGSYQLLNGGSIRTPGSLVVTYDPTKPNNHGVNLENYGVPPDVWVKNTAMDYLKKNDRELRAAIDEVLRMLKEMPGPVTSAGGDR